MNPFLLPLDLPITLGVTLWVTLLVPAADEAPAPEDYNAGWLGLAVVVALAVAVALLGVSLTRHLRKARDNADHGVFDSGDEPRRHAP